MQNNKPLLVKNDTTNLTCGQLTFLWPHSEIDWKHSCLTLTRSSKFAGLANLGYTSDIIIIIIIIIITYHSTVLKHISWLAFWLDNLGTLCYDTFGR